jgi:IS1 family transposase
MRSLYAWIIFLHYACEARIISGMNKLNTADRVRVVAALVEGNSINSTVRMTGISKPTILKLIRDLGDACANFHDREVQDVPAKRVQADEVWAFCQCKQKNVKAENAGVLGHGDVWTWTAIDADTKLMIAWRIGTRDATEFLRDVASRLSTRIQLTTDAHGVYRDAVNDNFGTNIDYAQLIKIFGQTFAGPARYSPAACMGIEKRKIYGDPDSDHISTSYVERSNLTVRMGMRRYTRLTNGFSKKIENHVAMTTIFFVYYNYCRIHMTLKVTPAMEAGLTDRLWEIADLVNLLG